MKLKFKVKAKHFGVHLEASELLKLRSRLTTGGSRHIARDITTARNNRRLEKINQDVCHLMVATVRICIDECRLQAPAREMVVENDARG